MSEQNDLVVEYMGHRNVFSIKEDCWILYSANESDVVIQKSKSLKELKSIVNHLNDYELGDVFIPCIIRTQYNEFYTDAYIENLCQLGAYVCCNADEIIRFFNWNDIYFHRDEELNALREISAMKSSIVKLNISISNKIETMKHMTFSDCEKIIKELSNVDGGE